MKPFLIKDELDIHVFDSLNCIFSLVVSLLKRPALIRSNVEIIRNKDGVFQMFDEIKVSRVPL